MLLPVRLHMHCRNGSRVEGSSDEDGKNNRNDEDDGFEDLGQIEAMLDGAQWRWWTNDGGRRT